MRVYSWNVNGIRSVARKEQAPWDVLPDADVIALQETKAHLEQLPKEIAAPEGWHALYSRGQRKGYSGVAIISKREPDEAFEGIGVAKYDREGRVVGARFGDVLVLSAYFPKSQTEGPRFEYKLGFCRALKSFLRRKREEIPRIVLVGDYNIAHAAIDLARPKENEGNPGFLPEERSWMTRLLREGFHDVFRRRHPELEGAYSWWSYRTGARERNIGWRIDYATVTDALLDRVVDSRIHPEVHGSDHCPVSVTLG